MLPASWRRNSLLASSEYLSTNDDIIEDARNGRMFILVDDEERENEGDLVIPAQMATPDAINFMATNGRGLICLALTQNRINQLNLHPMSQTNTSRHETAFTASIEAKEGVTTGISASDRARTIAVAIDATKGPEDIVSGPCFSSGQPGWWGSGEPATRKPLLISPVYLAHASGRHLRNYE